MNQWEVGTHAVTIHASIMWLFFNGDHFIKPIATEKVHSTFKDFKNIKKLSSLAHNPYNISLRIEKMYRKNKTIFSRM